jgi:RHS repeat-associated protein
MCVRASALPSPRTHQGIKLSPAGRAPDCRDARNTLTAVYENGVEVGRYDYDRNLIRVRRTTQSENVEYVLDDKHVLNELDGSQAGKPSIRRYHYGTKVLAVTESASTSYVLNDGIGSASDFWSSTGTLAKSRQYDAWGGFRNGSAPAVGEAKVAHTGHQYDPETGWVYAKARYYDSGLGVFLSRDPYEGEIGDAPSLHRYMYAEDNPLRFYDPTGTSALTANPSDFVEPIKVLGPLGGVVTGILVPEVVIPVVVVAVVVAAVAAAVHGGGDCAGGAGPGGESRFQGCMERKRIAAEQKTKEAAGFRRDIDEGGEGGGGKPSEGSSGGSAGGNQPGGAGKDKKTVEEGHNGPESKKPAGEEGGGEARVDVIRSEDGSVRVVQGTGVKTGQPVSLPANAPAQAAPASPVKGGSTASTGRTDLPGKSPGWIKLKGNQGWKDADGNLWKKDQLHKDHWDVSDAKGSKVREVDFGGRQIWPEGPKNKNK